jgi:hypothetical protein
MKFDASPTTLAAALAKAGASPDEVTTLTWGPGTKGQTEDDEDTDASS